MDTTVLTQEESKELRMELLNERRLCPFPGQQADITKEPVEIYGSDPYIVGGHTGSGYWVDIKRMTTVPGLFAAGETAAVTNKFVGGCGAEGRLAARGAVEYMKILLCPR